MQKFTERSERSLSSDENLDLRMPYTPKTFLESSERFQVSKRSVGLLGIGKNDDNINKEHVLQEKKHQNHMRGSKDRSMLNSKNNSKHISERSEKLSVTVLNDIKNEGQTPKRKEKGLKTNFIRFIGKVLKIMIKIRKNLKYTKIENLNKRQLEMINDYAFFPESEKKHFVMQRSYIDRVISRLCKSAHYIFLKMLKLPKIKVLSKSISKFLPVFKPSGRFKIYWNFLVLLVIALELFFVSIEVLVDHTILDGLKTLELLITLIFLMDMSFTFNTGYYSSGDVIDSRLAISKKYLKSLFVYDFLSVLGLILPRFHQSFYSDSCLPHENTGALLCNKIFLIKILFFLKIKQLKDIYLNLEEYLFNDERYESILSLLKLSIEILLFSHFLACFWIYITSLSSNERDQTWLSYVEALTFSSPWHSKYIYSLYWSFSTLLTVGYGDIHGKNEVEVGFSIVAIIFGCLFFAYAINSIGMLIDESNKKKKQLRSELRTINNHLKRNNVDPDLTIKVRKYLEYLYYEEGTKNEEKETLIMAKLSNSLRDDVLIQIYGNDLLENMAKIMKTLRFAPGDLIFEEGDLNNGQIYFLIEGEVEIFVNCERRSGEFVKIKMVKVKF